MGILKMLIISSLRAGLRRCDRNFRRSRRAVLLGCSSCCCGRVLRSLPPTLARHLRRISLAVEPAQDVADPIPDLELSDAEYARPAGRCEACPYTHAVR